MRRPAESLLVVLFVLVASLLTSSSLNSEAEEVAQESPVSVNVAAYNVRVGRNASAEEIGRMLKPYDLDVVCFSEAPGGNWTERAARELGMPHTVVGRYTTAGHADKYKTIASRTPLRDQEEILMADTLHTVTRAVTTVDGRDLAIYSVHFPYGWRDQAHIDETTGKVTAFINDLKARPADETAVIMGDFNFIPTNSDSTSPYHEMFIDIGLDLSWKDLGIDVTSLHTVRLFKPEAERTGRVIDHIMYDPSKARAVDGGMIELDPPMSDHKPVWATLELKAAPETSP